MFGVISGNKKDIDNKEKELVAKGYSRVPETVSSAEVEEYQYKRFVSLVQTIPSAAPSESIMWRSPNDSPSI